MTIGDVGVGAFICSIVATSPGSDGAKAVAVRHDGRGARCENLLHFYAVNAGYGSWIPPLRRPPNHSSQSFAKA